MNYEDALKKSTEKYPFKYWLEDYEEGLGQYSKENCRHVQSVFDGLIQSLINIGQDAVEHEKIELFEIAVKRLNLIRENSPWLIETLEREEFCELFDDIAVNAGIDLSSFSDGIASEWRAW